MRNVFPAVVSLSLIVFASCGNDDHDDVAADGDGSPHTTTGPDTSTTETGDTADDDDDDDDDDESSGPFDCPPDDWTGTGATYHVDPINGDPINDGSAALPWRSIQDVVDNKVDCVDRDGNKLNPGAPITGGDTIVLVGRDGHDPLLEISGCYNDAPVRIVAHTRREARLERIHFRGSANWRIEALSLVSRAGASMIRAEDHDTRGEAHDLEFVDNYLTSGDLVTKQDYIDGATDGFQIIGGAERIRMVCNELFKVGQAFTAAGDDLELLGNRVEFFTRDGIATGGHRNRFIANVIKNSIDLGDGHHDDFFQSHMGANPDLSSQIEIAYNIFLQDYPAEQPADTYGPTQCLSAFEDGPKTNIHIYNNVCKTDHYHGITWYGTNDSWIVNNTVIGGSNLPGLPPGTEEWPDHTWISVEGTGNVVRNNLTTLNNAGGDHNLEVGADALDNYFVDFLGLDLSLRAGAPAIDAGVAEGAPTDDVLGHPRDATPDAGAYEYGDSSPNL